MSYTLAIMKLINDPDGFFAEMRSHEVKLSKPALIVLLLAILVALNQYILIAKLSEAMPQKLEVFFKIGGYIGIAGSFVGMFAIWLIIAVIMHGLSAFFDGEGNFRRTFEFVGYGFTPSLVGSAITVPMLINHISKAKIPKIDILSLQHNPNLVREVVLMLIPAEIIYSNMVINLAITAWSLTIWTFAVKHARGLELRQAFTCALIPTALFGIYQLWSILKLL